MAIDISLLERADSPEKLKPANLALLKCFQEDDVDIDEISTLTRDRAMLVENLLEELQVQESITKSELNAFVKAELSINQQLTAYIEDLRSNVRKEILSLSKGKKAISQYTGKNVKLYKSAST